MKESRLYLNFLKRNFIIILFFSLIFSMVGFFYEVIQSNTYQITRLLQMSYTQSDVSSKVFLTDQAVALIRSENVLEQLSLNEVSLNAFKSGPLLINLSVSSNNSSALLISALNNASNYLTSNFPLKIVGKDVKLIIFPDKFLGILVGLGFGFLIGCIVSLVKDYFQTF